MARRLHLVGLLACVLLFGSCGLVTLVGRSVEVGPVNVVLRPANHGVSGTYTAPIRWSPDGRYLATMFHQSDTRDGIWLYEVSTGRFEELIENVAPGLPLTWLNDREIAYHNLVSLIAINVETGDSRILLDSHVENGAGPNADWGAFAVSPDSSRQVIVEIQDPGPPNLDRPTHLYELDLDTGEAQRLIHQSDTQEFEPRYSSGGQKLAYYRLVGFRSLETDRGDMDIVVITDGVEHVLDVATRYGEKFGFSPGGNWILYFSNDPWNPDYLPHHRVPGLYLLNLEQDSVPHLFMPLDEVPGGVARFDWSEANGRLAIITVGRPGRNELLISDPISEESLRRIEEMGQ